MHPDRGVTWGEAIRRPVALAVAVVLVLAANGHTTLAATGSTYDPAQDAYSMANTTAILGAQAWWDAGYTGAGVGVAVIDSGVAPVEGLSSPGKVIYGPDLSLESQSPNLLNLDTYGHGTFMAGLIAGRDDNAAAPYSADPPSVYRGVAPDARIVSLKVATADGGADVSQVIAAIGISGPAWRLTEERTPELAEYLTSVARRLSRGLGYSGADSNATDGRSLAGPENRVHPTTHKPLVKRQAAGKWGGK